MPSDGWIGLKAAGLLAIASVLNLVGANLPVAPVAPVALGFALNPPRRSRAARLPHAARLNVRVNRSRGVLDRKSLGLPTTTAD